MSFRITAYHIDQGPSDMFPVDVAHAIGRAPNEWSRVPWTDETRAAAKQRAQEAAEAAAAKKDNRGDRKPTQAEVARLQGVVDAAQAEADTADKAVDAAKAKGDDKAVTKARSDAETAHKALDAAQAELAAAKADAGKTDASKK